MKKNQLSKLALMGLATGAMITSTAALSANTVVETKGTYLAGGCGGAGKCGGANRSNPGNYTTDNFAPTSNSVVNPNMAPKPESLQTSPVNTQAPKPANGYNSCSGVKPSGSCGGVQPANGQVAPSSSHSCGGAAPTGGQTSSACGARNNFRR